MLHFSALFLGPSARWRCRCLLIMKQRIFPELSWCTASSTPNSCSERALLSCDRALVNLRSAFWRVIDRSFEIEPRTARFYAELISSLIRMKKFTDFALNSLSWESGTVTSVHRETRWNPHQVTTIFPTWSLINHRYPIKPRVGPEFHVRSDIEDDYWHKVGFSPAN